MAHEHSLTGELVLRQAYDAESKALKSKMIPMEMAIELSHEDGDSVTAHKAVKQLSLAADEAGSVLGSSKISVYSSANKQVWASPMDGASFRLIGSTNENGILTIDVCADKVKCEDACEVVAL
jgi:hypothetical protein